MNQETYNRLHEIVFNSGNYPGYRPEVVESPNGNGVIDTQKRYAHIAMKYLREWHSTPFYRWRELYDALFECHSLAVKVAEELNVPRHLFPSVEHSCLRVLEYPAGAGSASHTDSDLFTLALYRSDWMPFERHSGERFEPWDCAGFDVYMGEIGQLVGLGPALKHSVTALAEPQHSLVYFAIPDHNAPLANTTVGEWIAERMARSRY
jgi:hypothetical protein